MTGGNRYVTLHISGAKIGSLLHTTKFSVEKIRICKKFLIVKSSQAYIIRYRTLK